MASVSLPAAVALAAGLMHQHQEGIRQLRDALDQTKRAAKMQLELFTTQLQQPDAQLQVLYDQAKALQVMALLGVANMQLEDAVAKLQLQGLHMVRLKILDQVREQLAQTTQQLQQPEAREQELFREQQALRDQMAAQQPADVGAQLEQLAAQLTQSQWQLQQVEVRAWELLQEQQAFQDQIAAQQPAAVAAQVEQLAAQLAQSQQQLQQAEAQPDDGVCAICL